VTVTDQPLDAALGDEPVVGPDQAVGSDAGTVRRVVGWRSLALGALAYLALSVVLWWQVWSSHPTTVTTCGCGDTSLFTWFLAWPAYAIRHGMDPFYSTYLFHPTGVNLLANTAEVGLGIVLAPVTWAFGPVATLNVALTLSPALSAFTTYVLVRRWVAWAPAAFAAGLLYGFSPFVLVSLTDAHLMLGMAAVPPLVVLCLDELLVRQRWRWWVTGLAFAGLALVQFSVGTELLVIIAVAAAIGVVLVVVGTAVFRPDALRARAPYAVRGAVVGGIASVVVLAWPAWFALAGPAHLSGPVWGTAKISYGGSNLRFFARPMAPSDKVSTLTHLVGGYQGTSLSGQYLGIGLLTVLVVGLVVWRRDLRLWLFAAVGVICAFLSVGLAFHGWTLWRLVVWAPMMDNIIPSRFVLVTYLCAAVILGVVVDRTRSAAARLRTDEVGRRVLGGAAGLAVAAVALVPIASYLAQDVPLTAVPVQLPEWFTTVAPDLPPHQVLLVFPFAFRQSNMTWQAVSGMPFQMVGGGGPNSLLSRAGKERAGDHDLSQISFLPGAHPFSTGEVGAVRDALDGWGVTGIVLPDPRGLPAYEQTPSVGPVVALMTAATGQAPVYQARAWVWPKLKRAPPPVTVSTAELSSCVLASPGSSVEAMRATAACVLASAPNG